ncbi:MAG: hypothetical protein V4618_06765 [Pseudomonadota bacterium]
MTDDRAAFTPLTRPASASAEDGFVVLDGPNGVALTLTPLAAAQTGRNLIDAAAEADRYGKL